MEEQVHSFSAPSENHNQGIILTMKQVLLAVTIPSVNIGLSGGRKLHGPPFVKECIKSLFAGNMRL